VSLVITLSSELAKTARYEPVRAGTRRMAITRKPLSDKGKTARDGICRHGTGTSSSPPSDTRSPQVRGGVSVRCRPTAVRCANTRNDRASAETASALRQRAASAARNSASRCRSDHGSLARPVLMPTASGAGVVPARHPVGQPRLVIGGRPNLAFEPQRVGITTGFGRRRSHLEPGRFEAAAGWTEGSGSRGKTAPVRIVAPIWDACRRSERCMAMSGP
jgi:hypothetical protein